MIRRADQEKRRTLRPGTQLVLGSSDLADVQILDSTVSAEHCRVEAEERGVRVVDLGSKNGTYVGAGRISNVLLQGSCVGFSIGRTTIEIQEYREDDGDEHMGLVGTAPCMVRLREQIGAFAMLSKPVLILGESGTGKDVVARALHRFGERSGPYVETNAAAYPDSLIDAELFGVEKGAFTGAVVSRKGLFEEAHRGSLFLDEIAELSRAGQAKLLRVVEDGQVRALGTQGRKNVDVRLISATCGDLERLIVEQQFRADLFHRISLLTIKVPPLRKRLSDIPLLAEHFFRRHSDELGPKFLLPATVELLKEYEWPGNVRELFAVLYRSAILAPGSEIAPSLVRLPQGCIGRKIRLYPEQAAQLVSVHESVSAAARAAGIPRSTFRSMLKRAKVNE